jgi:hypothetical protein
MNKTALCRILRERASEIIDSPPFDGPERQQRLDDAELINVLARVVNGRPVERAFGAPGDWGYETAIGKALAE